MNIVAIVTIVLLHLQHQSPAKPVVLAVADLGSIFMIVPVHVIVASNLCQAVPET